MTIEISSPFTGMVKFKAGVVLVIKGTYKYKRATTIEGVDYFVLNMDDNKADASFEFFYIGEELYAMHRRDEDTFVLTSEWLVRLNRAPNSLPVIHPKDEREIVSVLESGHRFDGYAMDVVVLDDDYPDDCGDEW